MMEQDASTMNPAHPVAALAQSAVGPLDGGTEADSEVSNLADALAAIPDEVFARPTTVGLAAGHMAHPHPLALDVLESADAYAIHASVPGIDPAALDIVVFGESVRIAGASVDSPLDGIDARWLLRERPAGRFDRSVTLPAPVVPDAAAASVQDGVLVLTLPKAHRGTLTRIPVRALPASDLAEPAMIDA